MQLKLGLMGFAEGLAVGVKREALRVSLHFGRRIKFWGTEWKVVEMTKSSVLDDLSEIPDRSSDREVSEKAGSCKSVKTGGEACAGHKSQ